jgi:hypothetical protein
MGPEQQRLMDRLFNDPTRKLLNFKITPGDKPSTKEELCAEINKALDERERRYHRMADGTIYDNSCGRPLTQADLGPVRTKKPPVDVREMVKNLED